MKQAGINAGYTWLHFMTNLPVMQGINSETIDLIYLDPPFNSKRNYAAPIGSQAAGAAFKDTWNLDDIKREWVEEIEADNKATWASIISAGHISGESTQAYLTYMAIRLIEMRRILKDTGSIYLHCDSTVSHYLKLVMDAVFCASSFQSEISWKRTSAHNDSKRFGQVKNSIFYYSKTNDRIWNPVYVPHEESYVSNFYRYEDERGKYRLHDDYTDCFTTLIIESPGINLASCENIKRIYVLNGILDRMKRAASFWRFWTRRG